MFLINGKKNEIHELFNLFTETKINDAESLVYP